MTRDTASSIGGVTFACILAVLLTWPQATQLTSAVAAHHDAQFSIWRLGWIAHALATAPQHLFDANIFHPTRGTLAFSDATLLEGLVGAPLFWLGCPPTLVYNLLLLGGIAASGAAMFLLARHITASTPASLVATTVFTLLPYRVEHVMHLELQWTMFIPLTFLAWHRFVERRRWQDGAFAGLALGLQMLACVYYGAFLAMTLAVFVPALVVADGRPQVFRLVPGMGAGLAVAAALTVPFALPYLNAAETLGSRDTAEIARYSAMPINYLATTSQNIVWGWTADRWGGSELRLFPGAVSVLLVAASLAFTPRRHVLVYAATAACAFELSLGSHGHVYPLLAERIPALQGFRALSRFGAIASCAWALLAALGLQAIVLRLQGSSTRRLAVALVLGLMFVEYANRPMSLMPAEPVEPADVYRVVARAAQPGSIIELPLPDLKHLPGWDPQYQVWSLWHWRPLVNGYSGYHPRDYIDTVLRMRTFPDEATVNRLRAHAVRFVIVHRAFYDQQAYADLMLRFASSPVLRPWGAYRDPVGMADIFELVGSD
jgi:hypothetical protein